MLPWHVVVNGRDSVDEAKKTHNGCWNQHVRVKSQPGKVEANFDSEIVLDVIQRLVLVKVAKGGPIFEEE